MEDLSPHIEALKKIEAITDIPAKNTANLLRTQKRTEIQTEINVLKTKLDFFKTFTTEEEIKTHKKIFENFSNKLGNIDKNLQKILQEKTENERELDDKKKELANLNSISTLYSSIKATPKWILDKKKEQDNHNQKITGLKENNQAFQVKISRERQKEQRYTTDKQREMQKLQEFQVDHTEGTSILVEHNSDENKNLIEASKQKKLRHQKIRCTGTDKIRENRNTSSELEEHTRQIH